MGMAPIEKENLTMQVTAFQNGDEAAFGEIYPMISDKLLQYAMVMTGDPMEAEDLLQDTMIEVIRSIGNLRDTSAFTTWSIRIMRNLYAHKIRKNREVVARGEEDLEIFEKLEDDDMSARPDTAMDDVSVGSVVKAEMDRLPEEQRVTMVAFYYDGLSVREISEMMGVSENTTKSRLFAGRKAMKRGIEIYEEKTGDRLHEFIPTSIIIAMMHDLLADIGPIKGELLKGAFRKAVEETGISASVPDLAPGPGGTQPGPGDTGAQPGPGDTGAQPGPGDTGTQPGPGDTGTQPGPGDTGAQPGPGDTGAQPGPDSTGMSHVAKVGHAAEAGRKAAGLSLVGGGLKLGMIAIGIIAAAIVIMIAVHSMGGSSPDQNGGDGKNGSGSAAEAADSGISPELVDEYSRVYLSALSIYKDDIQDYTWQFSNFGDNNPPTKPVALKDVDGDGVPELFMMASVISDHENNWYSADLHIFTYKNNKFQELSYNIEYPGIFSAERNEDWAQYDNVYHYGRMVHFRTWEPNTSYTVFTGKTSGTLYILSVDHGSESRDVRMRKFTMDGGEENSTLTAVSDTYTADIGDPSATSEDPEAEVNAAISDMDEMVLYGGEVGLPADSTGEAEADPGKNGWQNILGEDADIAPESFQNSSSMSYDEAMALLRKQISDGQNDQTDTNEENPNEYIPLKRESTLKQAGNRLFWYDVDTYEWNYVQAGDDKSRKFNGDTAGSGSAYTNGTTVLYFNYSDGSNTASLMKYDLDSESTEKLAEFEGNEDPNAGHYIGTVYDGLAYIGFSDSVSLNKLWTCDLKTGEVTPLKERAVIRHRSGKYVLTNELGSLSVHDAWPSDIYELTGSGLKHVKSLGDKVSVISDAVGGEFYYVVSNDDRLMDVSVYRCKADGSGTERLGNFLSITDASILVSDYTKDFCHLYLDGENYKFVFETRKFIPIEDQ